MQRKEDIKKLWKLCFNDSDEFVERYFRLCYSNDTAVTIHSGNQLISALQMPAYSMTFGKAVIQTSYISGACTHPDFRGRGVMAQLLSESFSRMVQKNIPLSILIPANDKLFDYYAKVGYAPAFFRTPIKERVINSSTHKEYTRIYRMTDLDEQALAFCVEASRNRPNYVQHTIKDFKVVMEDIQIAGGSIFVATANHQGHEVIGVLFALPEEDCLKVVECLSTDESIEQRLIRKAALHYGRTQVMRYELPDGSPNEEAFGMARIINAKTILQLVAAAYPDEKVNIWLTDDELASNNGFYYIANGNCAFSENALEEEHMELTSGELSAWVFNRNRLYMSLMLE